MDAPLLTISFDDGRVSAATEGARILEQYGCHGSFYPITERTHSNQRINNYLSWADLSALQERGHEIGCHTHSHDRQMSQWPSADLEADIQQSLSCFAQQGIDVSTFCYPFGKYNPQYVDIVHRLGFKGARSIDQGFNGLADNRYLLKSLSVQHYHSADDLIALTREACLQRQWLILCFHHIDTLTGISTSPRIFEDFIRRVQPMNIEVLRLRDGWTESIAINGR